MSSRDDFEVQAERPVEVQCVPGGPMLVRGAASLRSRDGEEHVVERPVVAVCVCGFSRRSPWCDGTHKAATSSAPGATVLIFDSKRFKS